ESESHDLLGDLACRLLVAVVGGVAVEDGDGPLVIRSGVRICTLVFREGAQTVQRRCGIQGGRAFSRFKETQGLAKKRASGVSVASCGRLIVQGTGDVDGIA